MPHCSTQIMNGLENEKLKDDFRNQFDEELTVGNEEWNTSLGDSAVYKPRVSYRTKRIGPPKYTPKVN